LRISGDKQVQVVWIHGKIEHFNTHLLSGFTDDLFEAMFDLTHKYGPAAFGAPDEVVVDEVDLCSRVLIAHILPTIHSFSQNSKLTAARLLHV